MSVRTKIFLITAATATLVMAQSASAAWQWTNWGMTRVQVERAAAKRGILLTEAANSKPEQVELNAPYSTLGFNFVARLIFDERGTLYEVVLKQTDAEQCQSLELLLRSSYGVPYDDHQGYGMHTISWRDDVQKNDVQFGMYGPADYPHRWCDIQYSILADHKRLGL